MIWHIMNGTYIVYSADQCFEKNKLSSRSENPVRKIENQIAEGFKMKKLKVNDNRHSIGEGYSNIHHNKEYDYLDGIVYTKHGIVSVYSQGDDRFTHSTFLCFAVNGRCYTRRINRRYSKRYLVTLAKRFADEIMKSYVIMDKEIYNFLYDTRKGDKTKSI